MFREFEQPQARLSVLGKKATILEFNVALALDFYGINYIFQVSYFGGRTVAGGQVLDFLVFNPMPTPVEVLGGHWHVGTLGGDDRLRIAIIEEFLGRTVVEIYENECDTFENAKQAVRTKLL